MICIFVIDFIGVKCLVWIFGYVRGIWRHVLFYTQLTILYLVHANDFPLLSATGIRERFENTEIISLPEKLAQKLSFRVNKIQT